MRPIYQTLLDATPLVVPLDVYLTPFQVSIECEVVGTATYGVEKTLDSVWDPANITPVWSPTDITVLNAGATATQRGVQTTPCTALRFIKSAGAGSVKVRVVQSGVR
jgi:hypothetical protein